MTFTCSELGLLVTGTRPALSAAPGSRGPPHLIMMMTMMTMMFMMMTMMTMMLMLVRIRTMMMWYHEVGYDERQNMTKRVIYIQNDMYDLEESLVLAFVCCLLFAC